MKNKESSVIDIYWEKVGRLAEKDFLLYHQLRYKIEHFLEVTKISLSELFDMLKDDIT